MSRPAAAAGRPKAQSSSRTLTAVGYQMCVSIGRPRGQPTGKEPVMITMAGQRTLARNAAALVADADHRHRLDRGLGDPASLRLHLGVVDLDPVRRRRASSRARPRSGWCSSPRAGGSCSTPCWRLSSSPSGVVAFIHPGDTFLALAAVFSFFLIFAGTFDIIIVDLRAPRDRGLVAAARSAGSSSSRSGSGRPATTVAARCCSSPGWPRSRSSAV